VQWWIIHCVVYCCWSLMPLGQAIVFFLRACLPLVKLRGATYTDK
jgi:hypothetical protein